MEVQEGVIYYAAQKTAEKDPPVDNVRLILGDVSEILNIFDEGEVDVIYLNFSRPCRRSATLSAASPIVIS